MGQIGIKGRIIAAVVLLGGCAAEVAAPTGEAEQALFSRPRLPISPPPLVLLPPAGHGDLFDGEAGSITETAIYLRAGVSVTIETRNASADSDPVLHLLPRAVDGIGNTAAMQLAVDDNGGSGANARIQFNPSTSGTHYIVLRSANASTAGRADIYVNGSAFRDNVAFGGMHERMTGLRSAERLTTVPLPHGVGAHTLYVLASDGLGLARRVRSGPSGGAELIVGASTGTRQVIVGVNWAGDGSAVRLVRNDANLGDRDGDGLGNELEAAIGTCSSLSGVVNGFECARIADARDTDGDGLSDGIEVLGMVASAPFQRLPQWGADVRHKDLFVELDFMLRKTSETDSHMTAATARAVAAIYAGRTMEEGPATDVYEAQSLLNPDFEKGINLHFDTGVDPAADAPAEDATLYGDWGGHNAVEPVSCDGDGECIGTAAADAWRGEMHENRHGIFHYGLAYDTGGGSVAVRQLYGSWNQQDVGNTAHEFGHTLGLNHDGPVGIPAGANCKPNYPSLMSYAYLHSGDPISFSNGLGRDAINNIALQEQGAVALPTSDRGARYLSDLERRFGYAVDYGSGAVDLNRDGAFSTGLVGAYANENGSGCEMTNANSMPLLDSVTDHAPAMTRLGGVTYLLYVNAWRSLELRHTDSTFDCPHSVRGCPGTTWGTTAVNAPWNRRIVGVDAHPIVQDGESQLLVILLDSLGRLFETHMGAARVFTTPVQIAPAASATVSVSLAGDDDTSYLAYRGSDGYLRVATRDNATGEWSDDGIASTAAGAITMPTASAPGLLLVTRDLEPVELAAVRLRRYALPRRTQTLYGAFPQGPEGNIRLHRRDPVTHLWQDMGFAATTKSEGRPALAWAPLPSESTMSGRLYLMYVRRDSHHVKHAMTLMRRNGAGDLVEDLGLDVDHQNTWYKGLGVDLLLEPGVDDNLRALVARDLPFPIDPDHPERIPGSLEVRPRADGIIDRVHRNYNDWQSLGVGACRTTVAGSNAAHPIRCHDWIY